MHRRRDRHRVPGLRRDHRGPGREPWRAWERRRDAGPAWGRRDGEHPGRPDRRADHQQVRPGGDLPDHPGRRADAGRPDRRRAQCACPAARRRGCCPDAGPAGGRDAEPDARSSCPARRRTGCFPGGDRRASEPKTSSHRTRRRRQPQASDRAWVRRRRSSAHPQPWRRTDRPRRHRASVQAWGRAWQPAWASRRPEPPQRPLRQEPSRPPVRVQPQQPGPPPSSWEQAWVRLLVTALLGGVGVGGTQLLGYGRLHRGGRGLDELPHVLKFCKCFFGSDTELFGELVHAGLGHFSPVLARTMPRRSSAGLISAVHRRRAV